MFEQIVREIEDRKAFLQKVSLAVCQHSFVYIIYYTVYNMYNFVGAKCVYTSSCYSLIPPFILKTFGTLRMRFMQLEALGQAEQHRVKIMKEIKDRKDELTLLNTMLSD